MKIRDIIIEGGWDTTLTQNTVLHPKIVAVALQVVDKFVADFNKMYAEQFGEIQRGRPTGSSAHHEIDSKEDPTKVYGDIDLQMIAPESKGQGYAQFTANRATLYSKLGQINLYKLILCGTQSGCVTGELVV